MQSPLGRAVPPVSLSLSQVTGRFPGDSAAGRLSPVSPPRALVPSFLEFVSMPTIGDHARRDQYRAAAADARRSLAALTAQGARRGPCRDPWLIGQLRRLYAVLRSGRGQLCPHITGSPQVAHAAVWAPGRLVCSRCVAVLAPDEHEDTTCDRCRRPAAPIYPAAVQHGPVLLAFGLCRQCARRTQLPDTAGRPAPAQ